MLQMPKRSVAILATALRAVLARQFANMPTLHAARAAAVLHEVHTLVVTHSGEGGSSGTTLKAIIGISIFLLSWSLYVTRLPRLRLSFLGIYDGPRTTPSLQ